MKEEQFKIINEQLKDIMEQIVKINENIKGIEESQEVIRKELNIHDIDQIRWQTKVEKELIKLQDFI